MVTKKEYTEKEWLDEIDKMNGKAKVNLFNKFEMVMYKDDRRISYDDLTGSIIYFDNEGACITVEMPNTSSVQDIYKKMELICIYLNLPKEL